MSGEPVELGLTHSPEPVSLYQENQSSSWLRHSAEVSQSSRVVLQNRKVKPKASGLDACKTQQLIFNLWSHAEGLSR